MKLLWSTAIILFVLIKLKPGKGALLVTTSPVQGKWLITYSGMGPGSIGYNILCRGVHVENERYREPFYPWSGTG